MTAAEEGASYVVIHDDAKEHRDNELSVSSNDDDATDNSEKNCIRTSRESAISLIDNNNSSESSDSTPPITTTSVNICNSFISRNDISCSFIALLSQTKIMASLVSLSTLVQLGQELVVLQTTTDDDSDVNNSIDSITSNAANEDNVANNERINGMLVMTRSALSSLISQLMRLSHSELLFASHSKQLQIMWQSIGGDRDTTIPTTICKDLVSYRCVSLLGLQQSTAHSHFVYNSNHNHNNNGSNGISGMLNATAIGDEVELAIQCWFLCCISQSVALCNKLKNTLHHINCDHHNNAESRIATVTDDHLVALNRCLVELQDI